MVVCGEVALRQALHPGGGGEPNLSLGRQSEPPWNRGSCVRGGAAAPGQRDAKTPRDSVSLRSLRRAKDRASSDVLVGFFRCSLPALLPQPQDTLPRLWGAPACPGRLLLAVLVAAPACACVHWRPRSAGSRGQGWAVPASLPAHARPARVFGLGLGGLPAEWSAWVLGASSEYGELLGAQS